VVGGMEEYGDCLERELRYGGTDLESPRLLLEERFLSQIQNVVEWEKHQPRPVLLAKICMRDAVKKMTIHAEELSDYYVRNRDMQNLSEMIGVIEEGLLKCTGVNLWTLVEGTIHYQCDKYYELEGEESAKRYLVFLMETNPRWEEILVKRWAFYRNLLS